jgi:PAS domain S-box-containing protein
VTYPSDNTLINARVGYPHLPDRGALRAALFVAVAYYLGAKLGFALTLRPSPISTLWPPNSILLSALLLTPVRWWWIILLGALPAHFAVELAGGFPPQLVMGWFISNCSEALIGAAIVRHLLKGPLRFDRSRDVGVFIVGGAFLGPFLSSFLDAGFVTLAHASRSGFWHLWQTRLFSNVLTSLTLVPVIVSWATEGFADLRQASPKRYLEAGFLGAALLIVAILVFNGQKAGLNNSPALLYAPLPFVLWAAVRLGSWGTSTGLLLVASLAIWGAVHGHGPFLTSSPAQNAVSIQLFLIVFAVPMLILAAVIQERRQAEALSRESEERLNLALGAAQVGTWEWRIPKDAGSWSPKSKEILGLGATDTDLTLSQFLDSVRPEDRPQVREAIRGTIEQGTPYECEFRIVRPDSEVRWVLGKGEALYDDSGRPVGMLGVNVDITERKLAERLQREEATLRESEARFRELADTTPVMVWQSGVDRLCNFFNKAWLEFTGRKLEQELGNGWAELVHPDDLQHCLTTYLSSFEARQPFTMEYRLLRADGEHRWLLDKGVPRYTSVGEFVGYIGGCIDITEQKQAEHTLRESEAGLRELADAMPQIVWTATADGRLDYFNRQWYDITGADESSLADQSWLFLTHPDDRQEFLDAWRRAVTTGEPCEVEHRLRIAETGRYRWHLARARPVRDSTGTVVRWYASCTDIQDHKSVEEQLRNAHHQMEERVVQRTADLSAAVVALQEEIADRVAAERALRSSEERFGKAFHSSPDAIQIVRQGDYRFIEVNEKWEEMFGYSREEAIGSTADELNLVVDQEQRQRGRTLLESQGYLHDFEMEMRTRSGDIVQVLMVTDTLEMAGESCYIVNLRDVTARKRADMEAEEQRRELAHLSRVASLGELSGALAHELNQPLAAILVNTRAAQRIMTRGSPDLAEVRDILEDIALDDRRAGEVIGRLRALLKKGEARMAEIDLNELVGEVRTLLHSDLIRRRVSADTDLEPSLPLVLGERVQLQQVLINLVGNACDAMVGTAAHQRLVTISTSLTPEGWVQLSVRDRGDGVPEERLDRIFDAFFTTKENGLGLGLAICRSIVTAHGGRLWAENNSDGGATFQLVLGPADPNRRSNQPLAEAAAHSDR